jgi:hypothetical protein
VQGVSAGLLRTKADRLLSDCRLALGSRDLFTISIMLASLHEANQTSDQPIFLAHGSLFPAPPSPVSVASKSDQKGAPPVEVVGRVGVSYDRRSLQSNRLALLSQTSYRLIRVPLAKSVQLVLLCRVSPLASELAAAVSECGLGGELTAPVVTGIVDRLPASVPLEAGVLGSVTLIPPPSSLRLALNWRRCFVFE